MNLTECYKKYIFLKIFHFSNMQILSSYSCWYEHRGIYWFILLESESCPLVSEPWGVRALCVGDGENWPLVSDPSLSWFPLTRPALAAEPSACSAGGDGCFGDRCLFSSTALPTAKRPQTTGFPSVLSGVPGSQPTPPVTPKESELQTVFLLTN